MFSRTKRRKPTARKRFGARFCPTEPPIVVGKFKGQKLSELSDEELAAFLRVDAQCQTAFAIPNLFLSTSQPIVCRDLSQLWFAKYELERRRKEPAEREGTTSFKLTANDTNESIAQRLLNYGYWAASRKYHPDAGGDTRRMQQLTAARDFARARLKP